MIEVRPFTSSDEAAVIDLWHRSGVSRPWNDPKRDIARKMEEQPELFLVGTRGGRVVATAMAGYDGHRGWVYYMAVHPEEQGGGIGRELMRSVERALRGRGCQKINLMVRADNTEAVGFYERLGFTVEDIVSLGKRLDGSSG